MSDSEEDDRYGGYAEDSGKYDDDYGYEDEEAPRQQFQQYNDGAPEVEIEGEVVEDDLQNLDDQIYQEVLRQQQEKQKAQSGKNTLGDEIFDEYAHENLGDNFEETPWVPPSLELAWEYRLDKLYGGGKTKLRKIKVTKAGDLGAGIPMYFQFIKSIAILMFLCTLLCVPNLLFCYYGNKILKEDQDFIGLYRLTIGNIGHNTENPNYIEDAACTNAANVNMTCITVLNTEFTLLEVANILTVAEFLQVICFLLVIWYLANRTRRVATKLDQRTCTISDYSVMVEGIPADTTVEQLVEHFSRLYPLDKPDWKGRPPVRDATPVVSCYNTNNQIYKGTWVAEAIIFRKIGSLILAFKEKHHLMEQLLHWRAKMKMYKEDTVHQGGEDPKRFAKAEEKMLHAGMQIDLLTQKTMKQTIQRLKEEIKRCKEQGLPPPTSGLMGADAFAGFVVFNYCESMARCVEDYSRYAVFPWKYCMPEPMMFRGHRINVVKAPEPDEILWENLEISFWVKLGKRALTAAITIILLLIGFTIILQSAIYKQQFNEDVPKLGFCDKEIPALYAGNYSSLPNNPVIIRPEPTSANDLSCDTIIGGSFYAIYTVDGNESQPLADYSFDYCYQPGPDSNVDDECPGYRQPQYCPCVSIDSDDMCDTIPCYEDIPGKACEQFRSSTIAGCYCYAELLKIFDGGVLNAITEIMNQDASCNEFMKNYSIALFLTLAAALCTVIINKLLKSSLARLAAKENHNSIDEKQGAIMMKVFLATYTNMALVALFAYGYIKNTHSLAKDAHIMQGDYSDFSSSWYAQVGSYLVVTFFLEIFGPLSMGLVKYYIIYPCRRMMTHPHVSSHTSHKIATQHDLNKLELGGVFDVTVHSAQLLSLLFFGMTYAPGMPIMMPLSFIAFGLYFYIDKLLLCRFYQKPPHMGDKLMQITLTMLPFAAIIRLGAACWMYSNEFIFPYSKLNIGFVPSTAYVDTESLSEQYNSYLKENEGRQIGFINTGHRLTRGNVFPLFALFVIIIVYLILSYVWKRTPLYYMYRMIIHAFKMCSKKNKISPTHRNEINAFDLVRLHDPLRAEMAPFTGDYFQFLDTDVVTGKCAKICRAALKNDLTDDDVRHGWRVTYNGPNKVKVVQWLKSTRVGGVIRPKGSLKRTYEVISAHSCWSYSLDRVPAYKTAMQALKEGTDSMAHELLEEAGHADPNQPIERQTSRKSSIIEQYHIKKEAKKHEEVAGKSWKKKDSTGSADGGAKKKASDKKVTPAARAYKTSGDLYGAPDDDGDYGGHA